MPYDCNIMLSDECPDNAAAGYSDRYDIRDYIEAGSSDSAAIRRCLADARKSSPRTIVFTGRNFLIDEAIELASETTVIIDGCTIKQKDETFDNIFRGDNLVLDSANPYGWPVTVRPLGNIRILGKNGAALSGCDRNVRMYHPFFKETQEAVGDFWGWRTHLINFSCCTDFEIGHLVIRQTRGWALSFDFSTGGFIHDLDFDTHVKNGDGIDFRVGCSQMSVEHIRGFTSDDTVACTALNDRATGPSRYLYPSEPAKNMFMNGDPRGMDIHDVVIRNLKVSGIYHAVICLAASGLRVYNVTITDIVEGGGEARRTALISIYTGYGSGYLPGDIHDIALENITTGSDDKVAIDCNTIVCNCSVRNMLPDGSGKTEFAYPEGFSAEEIIHTSKPKEREK